MTSSFEIQDVLKAVERTDFKKTSIITIASLVARFLSAKPDILECGSDEITFDDVVFGKEVKWSVFVQERVSNPDGGAYIQISVKHVEDKPFCLTNRPSLPLHVVGSIYGSLQSFIDWVIEKYDLQSDFMALKNAAF